jgi:uncharacterized membrane protein YoaK (UPF0700 family)
MLLSEIAKFVVLLAAGVVISVLAIYLLDRVLGEAILQRDWNPLASSLAGVSALLLAVAIFASWKWHKTRSSGR